MTEKRPENAIVADVAEACVMEFITRVPEIFLMR
jgi:hypothetical protein